MSPDISPGALRFVETLRRQARAAQIERSAGREPYRHARRKVGRNEPCPCGSGKKYKRCHLGAV